jgi:hypothetical protein
VEFVTGLACAFRGVVHLAATPSLRGWALAPVAVAPAVLLDSRLAPDVPRAAAA